jgi:tyrosyl-tRNA synthetase
MGGSDQWGNITSGIDLIRRLRGAEAHAIVYPLITTSSGVKFGKTESGTVWLDPERTSPYRFYQFWFNTDDRDVVQYLKYFTLLPEGRIAELEQSFASAPEKREAQITLAQEVTKMLHGEGALVQAQKASKIFFGGEIADVNEKELVDIFSDVPSTDIQKDSLTVPGMSLIDLMAATGIMKSKGEARRAIQGGGIYLNNRRVSDIETKVTLENALHGKFIILRKGSRNYWLVRLV